METKSGFRQRFDAVASNADIMHSYKDLMSGSARGPQMAKSLNRKSFSPSLFVVHFGLEGTWPGIPHHMILFAKRYKGLLDDIYKNGVVPEDFAIYLHHPALVPVSHMGKMPLDWDEVGPRLEKMILDELERRLIPDIHSRIVTKFSYAPSDFKADLNAHMGSAFSLEPVLWQSAWLRGHNRDDVIDNTVGGGGASDDPRSKRQRQTGPQTPRRNDSTGNRAVASTAQATRGPQVPSPASGRDLRPRLLLYQGTAGNRGGRTGARQRGSDRQGCRTLAVPAREWHCHNAHSGETCA